MQQYQLYIDGEWVDPATGEWFESIDPYRGEPWARIPRGGSADAERAVEAARRAMTEGPWASMSASQRGAVMRKIGDLISANADLLAEVEVRDNGKLLTEVTGQIKAVSDCWHYYAGLADKVQGATIPLEKPNSFAFTTREPIGVVAALTAWNWW